MLTPRRKQVLLLTMQGLTVPQIARRMRVSRETVKTHRWNIRLAASADQYALLDHAMWFIANAGRANVVGPR